LILFWLLGALTPEVKKTEKKEENRMKVSLKELPKKFKDSGLTKKIIKPPKMAPPMPKGKQLKKIVKPRRTTHIKKPLIKLEPKKIKQKAETKKPPINIEKPKPVVKSKPKPKIEPLPPIKPYIPLPSKPEPKPKKSDDKFDSYDWLSEDKTNEELEKKETKVSSGVGLASADIKELYGEEFGKLTPGQQQYIIDKMEIMRRITQRVLNRVARVNLSRDLNVNRTNVIEFYLHPNGDMTDFKFLKKSGYYVLDNTTKETIEYAYSQYPRPDEKTLIRYNVFYNLARY